MPASKGLTEKLHLRMKSEERELIETVQTVYRRLGVPMSLNDTVRHLIRRGGIVLAHTPATSLAQIREHCNGCPDCDFDAETYGCPEGLYLYRAYRRVIRAHLGATGTDEL